MLFSIDQNHIAQINSPKDTEKNGCSIYGILHGKQSHYFDDELRPTLGHM